jgi:hypothetical protein
VGAALPLDEAVDLTRTGDVWAFRGVSVADRAIRALTNAPVNHVGMAVVLEGLPPLLPAERPRNWYDPGSFWSGDRCRARRSGRRSPSTCRSLGDPPAPRELVLCLHV